MSRDNLGSMIPASYKKVLRRVEKFKYLGVRDVLGRIAEIASRTGRARPAKQQLGAVHSKARWGKPKDEA